MLAAMTVRRVVPLLVCLIAPFTIAIAQPKTGTKPAPAKDAGSAAPAAGSAAGSGSADAPPPADEGPPADMEGKDENPNAPRVTGDPEVKVETKVPEKKVRSGYPIEEAMRPITLPANMAEVSLNPHAQLDAKDIGYVGSDYLRARYGVTRQIQLGLTYTLAGIYDDPRTTSDKIGAHPGKALGLDVTYLVKDFVGVRVGVPVWIYRPEAGGAPAIGLTIGVPLKFRFGEKYAIGGLDDLLAIKLTRFAPTFEHEYLNAARAAGDDINTKASRGFIRLGGYGVYQNSPKLALIGRIGITFEDFTATATQSNRGGGATTFLRGGLEYTVRSYLDVGFSLGFDDLSVLGSFGPAALLAFRI
jgi:hypothetical protein